MSEICRCVNAVHVLPCPVEVTDVEAGVTIGYGAEVVQSWTGVVEDDVCGRLYKIVPQIPFCTSLCKSLSRNF